MPVIAVQMAKEEVLRVGWIAYEMVKRATEAMIESDNERIKWVLKHEKNIDEIYHKMEAFLVCIPSEKLSPSDVKTLENLKHLLTDIERVGDHANNLAEFAEQIKTKKHGLSKYGRNEIRNLSECVLNAYGLALKALKTDSRKFIDKVVEYEDRIDKLEKNYKINHVNRLKKNICNPELDTIYVETLRNLERIGDHSYNIALSLTF